MSEYIYVDNSNVFIEGKRVSAVQNGLALSIGDALYNRILDNSFRLDFGKLYQFIAGSDPARVKRAMLFGSRPPQNDSIWEIAGRVGFEPVIEDRNVANKEKKIDTGIVAAMLRDAYKTMVPGEDAITLVAGDSDFVPAIRDITADGIAVHVVFWNHASNELKQICSSFTSSDSHLSHLSI
jgi:uncharacterized LabA/DUF88 family protein